MDIERVHIWTRPNSHGLLRLFQRGCLKLLIAMLHLMYAPHTYLYSLLRFHHYYFLLPKNAVHSNMPSSPPPHTFFLQIREIGIWAGSCGFGTCVDSELLAESQSLLDQMEDGTIMIVVDLWCSLPSNPVIEMYFYEKESNSMKSCNFVLKN